MAFAFAGAMWLCASGAWGAQSLQRDDPGVPLSALPIRGAGSERPPSEPTGEPQIPGAASADTEDAPPSNPEPPTWALVGAGFLAAAMIRRRMERRR